jgi:putative membrane protein
MLKRKRTLSISILGRVLSITLFLSLFIGLFFGLFTLGACENTSQEEGGRSAAAILNAANEGEIQHGQLAQQNGVNADARAYADKMVMEHSAAQQRQSALFVRLGISAQENTTSQSLRNMSKTMLDRLRTLAGVTFDKEYATGQVTMHQHVLNLLDGEVLPSQLNPELRLEVQNTRASVAAHLQEALMLQQKLNNP